MTADDTQDKDFVEYIVRNIVGHPDDVRVERTVDEMGVLLTLHINQEDMGYVIGKQGQTARAIRTLVKIVGAKNSARVNLKIYEPEGSRHSSGSRQSAPTPTATPTPTEPADTSMVDSLKI